MKWIILAWSFLPEPALPPIATSEVVQKNIAIHGVRSALKNYFQCDNDTGYTHIAEGTMLWLGIAEELIPFAGGCVEELMHDALARAVLKEPWNALPLVNKNEWLRAEEICVRPIAEKESAEEYLVYLNKLEDVLKRMDENKLQKRVDACLARLGEIRETFQTQ